jgi:hypothetical protein
MAWRNHRIGVEGTAAVVLPTRSSQAEVEAAMAQVRQRAASV